MEDKKLSVYDTWMFNNVLGIIKTQKSLVEKGAQTVINWGLVKNWLDENTKG